MYIEQFIDYLKTRCDAKEITTTYIFGNNHAKHVYEKAGFIVSENTAFSMGADYNKTVPDDEAH